MRTSLRRRIRGASQRALSLLCALAMLTVTLPLQATPAYASFNYSVGGCDIAPLRMLNDDTVYAIHFSATDAQLVQSTDWRVNARFTNAIGAGNYGDARGFSWNPSLSRWVHNREAAAMLPVVVPDASGHVEGWVYFKFGDENFTGWSLPNAAHAANQGYITVGFQDALGGNTGSPLSAPLVTVLNAKTEGAWVHNGMSTGAGAAVLVDAIVSGDTTPSAITRTESNGIDDNYNGVTDDEGSTGSFRVGVPASANVNISLAGSPWASGQGVTAGPADTDIAIGAADQSAPSSPTAVAGAAGHSRATLSWAPSTDSGGSGLAGYRVYRMVPVSPVPAGAVLWSATARLVGAVGAGTTTFTETGLANGTPYSYFVRATDADTNVSARSTQVDVTPVADTGVPAAVSDLAVTGTGATSVDLAWTAPGNDGSVGTAVAYDLRYSTAPIADDAAFDLATQANGVPAPQIAGTAETFSVTGLTGGQHYYFALKTSDEVPNWSALSNQADGMPAFPIAGTMSLNNEASYTTTRAVSINSTVTGAAEMRKRNLDGGGNWGAWTPYSATVAHQIQQGDGTKTVEVEYRDAIGNVLARSDTIILDTTAPSGTMSLNNEASYTTTRAVSINSTVTGAAEMRKRNLDGGGNWGAWTPYSATVAHQIQQGDGTKTVEVEYRDSAGNVGALSDTIMLDGTSPTGGSISIDSGASSATTTSVTLTVSASDALSGVAKMRFSNSADLSGSGWVDYATSAAWKLASADGVKTVYAQFRDAAGNVTTGEISDTILLETGVPSGTMSVNGDASYTTTRAVTVESSIADANEMRVREEAGTWSDWVAYAASAPILLSEGDGSKTVEAEYKSAGGNVFALSDVITLDTTAPSGVMSLNNEASYTTTRAVSINSAVTGAAEMRKRNLDGGGNWGAWTPYSATVAHQIQQGDGTKTVEVEYRDAAGNVGTRSDSLILDTIAPTVTVNQALSQDDPTHAGEVVFDVGFSESITGLVPLDFTTGGSATGFDSVHIDGSGSDYKVTLSGTTVSDGTVALALASDKVTDLAGNGNAASTSSDNSVTYDGTAPIVSGLAVSGYSQSTVSLNWSGSDASGIAHYRVWRDSEPAVTLGGTSYTFTGLAAGTNHTFHVQAIDDAGNNSVVAVVSRKTAATSSSSAVAIGSPTVSLSVSGRTATVRFRNVTKGGTLSISPEPTPPAEATGASYLRVGDMSYEIAFTGAFTGGASVTLPYDPALPDSRARDLRVRHLAAGGWETIAPTVNVVAHTITFTLATLSPVVVVEPVAANKTLRLVTSFRDHSATMRTFSPYYGASVTLSATLKDADNIGVAGKHVTLKRLSGRNWVSVGQATEGSKGVYTYRVTARSKTLYRFVVEADGFTSQTTGASYTLYPKVRLSLTSAPRSIAKGKSFRLKGKLTPRHAKGTRLTLRFYKYSKGTYRYQYSSAVKVTSATASSVFSKKLSIRKAGTWRVAIYSKADMLHQATMSATRKIKVK